MWMKIININLFLGLDSRETKGEFYDQQFTKPVVKNEIYFFQMRISI